MNPLYYSIISFIKNLEQYSRNFYNNLGRNSNENFART